MAAVSTTNGRLRMYARVRFSYWVCMTAPCLAVSAWAQQPQPTPPPQEPAAQPAPAAATAVTAIESGNTPTSATVEKIMEEAVKNISRRYNLNEAQTAETQKLMKAEVNRFLKDHEAEVWPAIRDLLAAQLGAKPPDNLEETKRIGKSARPLAALAKDAIIKANEEWRMYLTPEQKVMHDYDMAEMEKTFAQVDKNFGDWEAGRPTDAGLFPPPPPDDRSPPRPRKPATGLPEPEVETFRVSIFDTFVEEFIKDYQLDQGQIDSARSILKEFKVKAKDFKAAKQEALAKIAADQKAAMEARDRDKIAATEAARKKVLEPVYALFGEMEERLKGLLTSGQIEQYASQHKPGQPKPLITATDKQPAPSPEKATAPAAPPTEPPTKPESPGKKQGD